MNNHPLFSELLRCVPDAACWLVGFSGGADSTALLELCTRLAPRPRLLALHLNHGIRGTEADGDEEFCREFCRARGIEFRSRRVDVPAFAKARGLNLEDAARRQRHLFFAGEARQALESGAAGEGGVVVLLAHHADDQDETVLMRLMRGCGWRGLGGMREYALLPVTRAETLRVYRPLLGVTRAEILEFLRTEGIVWREDASNASLAHARNRLRLRVLPELERALPESRRLLRQASARAREIVDYVEERSREIIFRHECGGVWLANPELAAVGVNGGGIIAGSAINAVAQGNPAGLFLAAAERMLEREFNLPPWRQENYAEVARILAGQAKGANLPGGFCLRREKDGFFVYPRGFRPELTATELPGVPGEGDNGFCRISLSWVELAGFNPCAGDRTVEFLNPAALQFPLVLRAPLPGERMRPLGAAGSVLISDLLQDLKIPHRYRQTQAVLADAQGVVWLPPCRIAQRVALPGFAGEAVRAEFSRK